MTRFVWSPQYELGIDVIDHQHQRIVDYINLLYETRPAAAGDMELQAVLTHLVDYTLSHFAFEESMLEEVDYPDLREHQLRHLNFSHLIERLQARFQRGEAVAGELAQLLQDWLISHIMTEDKQYAALVKQKLLATSVSQSRAN